MKKKYITNEAGMKRQNKNEPVKKTGLDFACKKNAPIYFPKKRG